MHGPFNRLVRFRSVDGEVHFGEAGPDWTRDLRGQSLATFTGQQPWEESFRLSGQSAIVSELLCPLEATPAILGVGLNYRSHLKEMGDNAPEFPVVFTKHSDSLAGPLEAIPVHPDVQQDLDYEGELCFVIGRDIKNFEEKDNVWDYILGFMAGNDVSSRYWSAVHPERSGGQHSYGKSFDKFAPVGPVIASVKFVGDPENLRLSTSVNGELRQRTVTSDLVFNMKDMLRHLSRGTTLKRGTIVMTGTPSGVGISFQPPKWLKHDDQVVIEIEKIGSIVNRFVFEP